MSLRESEVFQQAPRRHRGKPERQVQRAILAYLRSIGCLVVVTDAGAAYRAGAYGADTVPAGWPDITGLLPDGRFIGVECKSPTGRQSPMQKRMEQEIRKRNGIYVLARGVEDVDAAFSE
ncbi:MAG: VRR-NUC domain-containing protein [Planctomycetaceae bacterium]|nr:MAG: VRR-NUC domain-containing protein [Planctomycetaceae bacterium]